MSPALEMAAMMEVLGRWLIFMGVLLVLIGGVVLLLARFSIPLGRLPGDIVIHRENFTCVFPLATSILLSLVLTVLLNLLARMWK